MARRKWWAARKEGERTNEYLARVLYAVRLPKLAEEAKLYHFDDYRCPIDKPWAGLEHVELVKRLRAAETDAKPARRAMIEAIVQAVIEGEFDATREESDEWAASPDGQETLRLLLRG